MQNELEKQVNFLVYSTPEQDIKVNAVLKDEFIWLTQKAMAELFDCSTDNISLHLKNIYGSNELQENATTEEFSVVQIEGSRSVNRKTKFYNLDAIISVGKSADEKAESEYDILNRTQKINSDFDNQIKKIWKEFVEVRGVESRKAFPFLQPATWSSAIPFSKVYPPKMGM